MKSVRERIKNSIGLACAAMYLASTCFVHLLHTCRHDYLQVHRCAGTIRGQHNPHCANQRISRGNHRETGQAHISCPACMFISSNQSGMLDHSPHAIPCMNTPLGKSQTCSAPGITSPAPCSIRAPPEQA